MAALPANPTSTISPAEMQILVSRAGLVLNPGQVADLVLAWRQVAGLIAGLPQDRPLLDDMALNFRLLPPVGVTGATSPQAASPGRAASPTKASPQPKRARARVPAKAVARPSAKPVAKAAAKAAARTPAKGSAKARAKAPARAKTKAPAKIRAKVRVTPARKPAAARRATRRR